MSFWEKLEHVYSLRKSSQWQGRRQKWSQEDGARAQVRAGTSEGEAGGRQVDEDGRVLTSSVGSFHTVSWRPALAGFL